MDRASVFVATGGYAGFLPGLFWNRGGSARRGHPAKWSGAGLIGTLEGLALAFFLPREPKILAFFLAAAVALSCLICGRAEKTLGTRDDPRIILDEIAGFCISVFAIARTPFLWGSAFVLFRVLDSAKPFPLRQLERLPGGIGVMADDVGAAVAANLLTRAIAAYAS